MRFEDYLVNIYMSTAGRAILDDDLPDHYDDWLANLDTETIIEYAESWHNQEVVNNTF